MPEWSPEAEECLTDYLDRVAQLSREQGDDADEIIQELKTHVGNELEKEAGAVVTLEALCRILAGIGTPEEVTGFDGAIPSRESKEQGPPSKSELPKETAKSATPSRVSRVLIWILAILLGSFSLFFELLTGVMADLYRNPIPTPLHVFALLLIPVTLGITDICLSRRVLGASRRWYGVLLFLNGTAAALSALYAAVYLPILPIAAFCVLVMGLGLMGFSPLFCTLASLDQMRFLHRNRVLLNLSKGWAVKRTLAGTLGIVLVMVLAEGPSFIARQGIRMAIIDDEQSRERGMKLIRLVAGEEEVLKACYVPLPVRGSRLAMREWPEAQSLEQYRELYYRLTGKPFNSVPKPKMRRRFLAIDDDFGDWEDVRRADSEVGGTAVAGRVKGLSLGSSTIDVNLASDPGGTAGPALAYLEWTLEFLNESRAQREARAQIQLPHDAVCSRLTLWIDGEEQEAAFGGRGQVRQAYQEVAVVRRRDPALLTTTGPDRVLLQCFPVQPHSRLKVKVGITVPLVIRNDKAYLRLPHFSERNFTIPPDFTHAVWAEAQAEFASGAGNLNAGWPAKNAFAVRGKLTEQQIQSPGEGLFILPASPANDVIYSATLGSTHAFMTLQTLESATVENPSVCLVVDGSARMGEVDIDWDSVIGAMSPNAKVNAIFAGQQLSMWEKEFAPPSMALAQWIVDQEYAGGCDPGPALEQAWEMCAAVPGKGYILWIHAPYPVELSSTEALRQRLFRDAVSHPGEGVQLLSLSVHPGPNRIEEAVGDFPNMENVPQLVSLSETLKYAARNLRIGDGLRNYRIEDERVNMTPDEVITTTSRHLVRLAVHEKVRSLARSIEKADVRQAQDLAVKTRLVTPVSGAVVLERAEQYGQYSLDPWADEEAIPAIPEPEEWALIMVAVLAMLYLIYKRRRQLAHLGTPSC